MTDTLKGKVCIVTGSGQGIGRGIALAIAKEGAAVITNNRRPGTKGGDAETTASEIIQARGIAAPFFGNVSEAEISKKLMQYAINRFGQIDILVDNAGAGVGGSIWKATEESFNKALNTHLRSTFLCTRFAIDYLKEKKNGRIINCASGSWLGTPGLCVYSAAKAGIVGFTRSVAADIEGSGITCNAYHPFSYSRLVPKTIGEQDNSVITKRYEIGLIDKEEFEWQSNPPPPEAVGPFIAYLASDQADSINGKVFYVSGGKVALYSEPVRKATIHKSAGFWSAEELIDQVPGLFCN
ncbi:MAG: SDR family oxidoreductase [Deltaproteobacteria bacterium]|nr:SDR family oxidoreductase [Deltaproteobacteria bacterium]MBT7891353.1 SDR family oxidoreductase [Deltaproteobacteria bacterium]